MFRLRSDLAKKLPIEKKTFQTREALICSQCDSAVELFPLSMKFGDGKYLDKCAVLAHLATHVDMLTALARELETAPALSDWNDAQISRGFAVVTGSKEKQSQAEAHSPSEAKARRAG
jgi:hypothetical protein